jgi:hypothetical protein
MSFSRQIPKELLILYPHLSIQELRAIINVVWNSKNNITRQADRFRVKLRGIGVMRSRVNKKDPNKHKKLTADRKAKQLKQRKKELTKEYLLW